MPGHDPYRAGSGHQVPQDRRGRPPGTMTAPDSENVTEAPTDAEVDAAAAIVGDVPSTAKDVVAWIAHDDAWTPRVRAVAAWFVELERPDGIRKTVADAVLAVATVD